MAYTDQKHGQAEYNRYMQIPSGVYNSIEQEADLLNKRDEKFAELVYVVGGGNSSPTTAEGLTDSNMSVISGASITISNTPVGLGSINPLTKLVRISFTGSGDVRLTYDGTDPIAGSLGEIWFKGGFLPVNNSIASTIKLIRDTTTNSAVYVTQFG